MLPRIVVVDPTPTLARIARGVLALLGKACVLIEVPSAEAALNEVAEGRVALVLAVYQLPDLDGVQFSRRVRETAPTVPVIVLADADDPLPSPEVIAAAPCRLYVRPVAEAFLRGLRATLEGETAAVLDAAAPVTDDALGRVPPAEVDTMRGPVAAMMRDVGALGALVADRTGRILFELGATGALDRAALATMAGAALTRTAPMGSLVGGNPWTMHYYDGERFDVFVLALGLHYFLALIFDGANRSAFGPVTMYGRRVADQLIRTLGEAAYRITPASQPDGVGGGGVEQQGNPTRSKARRGERATSTKATPVAETAADSGPRRSQAGDRPAQSPPTIDLEALFGQAVDEELAERLFDPDELKQLAASLGGDDPEQVGYDDVHDLDIFNE